MKPMRFSTLTGLACASAGLIALIAFGDITDGVPSETGGSGGSSTVAQTSLVSLAGSTNFMATRIYSATKGLSIGPYLSVTNMTFFSDSGGIMCDILRSRYYDQNGNLAIDYNEKQFWRDGKHVLDYGSLQLYDVAGVLSLDWGSDNRRAGYDKNGRKVFDWQNEFRAGARDAINAPNAPSEMLLETESDEGSISDTGATVEYRVYAYMNAGTNRVYNQSYISAVHTQLSARASIAVSAVYNDDTVSGYENEDCRIEYRVWGADGGAVDPSPDTFSVTNVASEHVGDYFTITLHLTGDFTAYYVRADKYIGETSVNGANYYVTVNWGEEAEIVDDGNGRASFDPGTFDGEHGVIVTMPEGPSGYLIVKPAQGIYAYHENGGAFTDTGEGWLSLDFDPDTDLVYGSYTPDAILEIGSLWRLRAESSTGDLLFEHSDGGDPATWTTRHTITDED